METCCAENVYEKSEENFIRYNPFIGDGDCLTFQKISQSIPYEPDYLLKKEKLRQSCGDTNWNSVMRSCKRFQR